MTCTSIYPIDPNLAIKAAKLQIKGLGGKAIAEKLRLKILASDANVLAAVGRAALADESAALTENELRLIKALALVQRDLRARGIVSSPKAHMLCRIAKLSEGQIARLTRKRIGSQRFQMGQLGLLTHSPNGHIWLEPAGWTLVRLLDALDVPA